MSDDTKSPGMSRTMSAVLFASMAFNFIIVGAFIGFMLRHDGAPMRDRAAPPLRDLGFGAYSAALPRDQRRMLAQDLQSHRGELEDSRAALHSQMQALAHALETTPFDADSVKQVMEEQERLLLERQRLGRRLFLDHIARMSDEQRRSYAHRVAEISQRIALDRGPSN